MASVPVSAGWLPQGQRAIAAMPLNEPRTLPGFSSVPQQSALQPKFRLQAADYEETPRVPKTLPQPEELGIAPPAAQQLAATTVFDWNAIKARLNRLDALSFRVDRIRQGIRVTIHLPTNNPGQMHLVVCDAETEDAALDRALREAEEWVRQTR
jgi:hypothetical protein